MMQIGLVEYRIISIKRKWYQRKHRVYIETDYCRWGPMPYAAARRYLNEIDAAMPRDIVRIK